MRPFFSAMNSLQTTNHYSRNGLTEAILAALISSGKDPATLTTSDLAPIDELHVRGRKATIELAAKLELNSQTRVLDIGSGIGGAARYLAESSGCSVIGMDLTFEYCRAAATLGKLTGLSGAACYLQGDAAALPFADACFDCVWTVHTAMNIPDKERFCNEIRRVLKPGGVLALYDILAGSGGEIHTPVPWAKEPAHSHLSTPQELRQLLDSAGFFISHWQDRTEEGRLWFSRLAERSETGAQPPPGVQLLFGSDFPAMAHNQVRNLSEERIILIECTAVRHS